MDRRQLRMQWLGVLVGSLTCTLAQAQGPAQGAAVAASAAAAASAPSPVAAASAPSTATPSTAAASAPPTPAAPAAAPPSKTKAVDTGTAETLMRKSALWDQLGSLARQLRSGVAATSARAAASQPADARSEKLIKLSAHLYSTARFQANVAQDMASHLNAAEVPALVKWMDSPLGTRIASMERKTFNSMEDRRTVAERRQKLMGQLPPARTDLLQHVVKASRVAEGMANVATSLRLAMLQGADKAGLHAATDLLSQARQTLDAQRPQLVELLTRVSVAAYADTYAALSDQELNQYIAFLESPPGVHFTELSSQAIERTLAAAAQEFGAAAASIGMGAAAGAGTRVQ